MAKRAARRAARGHTRGRAAAALAGVVLVGLAVLQVAIDRGVATPLEVRRPDGSTGTALVLYHPGLGDFQERLTDAFARGLEAAGWRVERTTTSASAPTELAGYDLLVLGVHTYWFAPDGPTRRWLARAELGGTPVVALVSALGAAERALRVTADRIAAAGGRILAVEPYYVMHPNDEADPRPNVEVALARAFAAGRATAP